MTGEALLGEFLRHLGVERALSLRTCESYRYQLQSYLRFLKEHGRDAVSAVPGDVLAYRERRKAEGLKSSSLFAAAVAVRQFHLFLVGRYPGIGNPTIGLRLPKLRQRLPRPLAPAEIERIIVAAQGTGFTASRNVAMLEILYATGMRVSEMTGLDLGRVDLTGGWARILGKGGRERLVPLSNRAKAALQRYLEDRSRRHSGPVYAVPDAPLFLGRGGKRLGRGSFWLILRILAHRAGIKGRVFPHQFRHGAATCMLEGGADIRVVQEMLGHRSLSTTMIYTHVSPGFLRRACERAHPAFHVRQL